MDDSVHLKVTTQCLAAVGFWPIKLKSTILAIFYAIYYWSTITTFVVFVFSQFVALGLVVGKSLEEFSGLMAINFLYTLGLVKIWVIGGPVVKKLVKKIQVTEQNILKCDDAEIKQTFMEHVTQTYFINRLMMGLGIMCFFMFMLTPVLVELTKPTTARFELVNNETLVYLPRTLPLVSWFPFDENKYYGIAYAWHAYSGYVITTYIVACNNMFFALMIFAVGQIKILQYYILNLTTATTPKTVYQLLDVIVADNLRKIITYHNAIIRFVAELDSCMRFFLLLDFAACALQIAMIGFEIAVADLSFQLLKNIIYMGSMVTQLFLFYWHGNEVLLESLGVADAVWECPWYECTRSSKKTLLQIMMRSQKPLRLAVGSFYHMSTATMVTILRSSYTYAAVMRQFYSRKLNN